MSISNKQELTIHCGKTTNSFEELKALSEQHANELKLQLNIAAHEKATVTFWTEDFPELICIGTFEKDDSGETIFILDFSESTL